MSREQMLKEARTIEAIRKGYMGLEGKFSTITKRLGNPIYHQGSLNVNRTYLDDPFDLAEEEIPTLDDEDGSYEIGLQFDGLSRGMNLTISVLFHLREITVRSEGRVVYRELAGELEGYAPAEWESQIESLFTSARKIERQRRPVERQEQVNEANKKRTKIYEELKLKWGL